MFPKLASTLALLSVCAAADAGIIVNLRGEQGSSLVSVTATGSFTATSNVTASFFGRGAGWSGSFAQNVTIDNGLGLNPANRAPVLLGNLSVSNGASAFALAISIDGDPGVADDFGFFKTDGSSFAFSAGEVWTMSGSSSFDLTQLGSLAAHQSPTFDDLALGTFTTNLALGGAGNVLSDTITLDIALVPAPPTALLLCAGALAAGGAVRRRRHETGA